MNKEIVISIKTILITLLFLVAGYFIYRLGPVVGILLVAGLLVVSLEPAVAFFMKVTFLNKPLPRGLAVTLTYIAFISILVLIFTLGLPPILSQTQKMILNLNEFLQKDYVIGNVTFSPIDLAPDTSEISPKVLSVTYEIFAHFATILSTLVVSIYMSLDWDNLKNKFVSLFSGRLKNKVVETIETVEADIGHWVKGQLTLMVAVGVMCFFGLVVLGVDYPLALGLISGVLEIIPLFGPFLSAILAAIVGFTISPVKGLAIIGLYILVQQLENDFLVPKIMHKVSGFSSLTVLVAILIGGRFFGIVGAMLTVPITMIGWIIVRKILEYSAGSE